MNQLTTAVWIAVILASTTSNNVHAALSTRAIPAASCKTGLVSLTYPEFRDKVVVITGGGSGIGLATAQLLAASGARVVIIDRELPVISAASGPTISVPFLLVDIADEVKLTAALGAIYAELHRIDALVANAGIHASGSILDTSLSQFDAVMNVNLRGTFNTVHQVANIMSAQSALPLWGRGAIAVIGSDQSLIGKPGSVAYGTSKAALTTLVRSSALELIKNAIRINLICPGSTDTPFLDQAAENHARRMGITSVGMKDGWETGLPGGRFVTAEEVAQSIVFVVGPRSNGLNGAVVPVDRGSTAH